MATNGNDSEYGPGGYMSDFAGERNSAEILDFSRCAQAQSGAYQCAYPNASVPTPSSEPSPLGEPLTIDDVAELLGCSPWTVRQRYLKQGLPFLQARPRGKIIFFREQVVSWIRKRQQQKGGFLR